jgi:hypothetical protein
MVIDVVSTTTARAGDDDARVVVLTVVSFVEDAECATPVRESLLSTIGGHGFGQVGGGGNSKIASGLSTTVVAGPDDAPGRALDWLLWAKNA